ncbi:MAG: hypothetical protein C0508_18530 [Cyanobacteria bacterium PR.023]|nr:hypothetical protein [Cyanobacteria bacterium PR.023]
MGVVSPRDLVSSWAFGVLVDFRSARLSNNFTLLEVIEYLELMEKLIILELTHGNHTKADEYSRKSLELATSWKT